MPREKEASLKRSLFIYLSIYLSIYCSHTHTHTHTHTLFLNYCSWCVYQCCTNTPTLSTSTEPTSVTLKLTGYEEDERNIVSTVVNCFPQPFLVLEFAPYSLEKGSYEVIFCILTLTVYTLSISLKYIHTYIHTYIHILRFLSSVYTIAFSSLFLCTLHWQITTFKHTLLIHMHIISFIF